MFQKSDLPFGSEFSPSQIDLVKILELAYINSGDWKGLELAIMKTYFINNKTTAYNKRRLASNCKLGMIAYGIIDRKATLTAFGNQLYKLRHKKHELYKSLANHILKELHGMSLVQCIQDMTVAGESVTLTTLRAALAKRNIHYPSGGKHPSIMRLWLAKAGVFLGKRWQIDEGILKVVLGINPDEFAVLASFTAAQRAFIRALANTGLKEPQPSNDIVRLASAAYGIKFPEKSLPRLVLTHLANAGYITLQKTTSGRGAKPFLVALTNKAEKDIVEPLLRQLANQTDPKLASLLRKPLAEILTELTSKNRHIAGLALEALGFKLMQLLNMEYVATRLRGSTTGGAEVDLIFQSARLAYSRWQVQCKNTATVSLDDVAKEVGLTHFLKSNVIIIVSTGGIGSEARKYSNKIMAESNLAIVMLDGADLKQITAKSASIVDIFEREAHHAMTLKKL